MPVCATDEEARDAPVGQLVQTLPLRLLVSGGSCVSDGSFIFAVCSNRCGFAYDLQRLFNLAVGFLDAEDPGDGRG
jgi:hypothetical protein